MSFKRKDIEKEIPAGTTFNGFSYTVIVNGAPKNLTNTIITGTIREGNKEGNIVKEMEVGVGKGFTKTNPVAGQFAMDAWDADFGSGTFYYDVKFQDGNVKKVYTGGSFKVGATPSNKNT